MKRIAELDGIRGLAALAIMVNHLPFNGWFFRLGAYGVDLFFVLSGYLITTIILKNADAPGFMTAFYARRSLRIWPIYYLLLVFVVLVNPFLPRPEPMEGWPYYFTYLQGLPNYWFGRVPPFSHVLDHTWTLALEEQYYLIWPALLLLAGGRSVIPAAILICACSFAARGLGFSNRILLGRADGFALGGVLAALLLGSEDDPRWRLKLLIGFVVAFLAAGSYPAWSGAAARILSSLSSRFIRGEVASSIRFSAISLLFFAIVGLILVLKGKPLLGFLRDRRLCYLGQISYGIYLYHYPIYCAFDSATGRGGTLWGVALKAALSLGVAAASWHCLERPILKLKDRFEYRAG